jgi:hypothetical protein
MPQYDGKETNQADGYVYWYYIQSNSVIFLHRPGNRSTFSEHPIYKAGEEPDGHQFGGLWPDTEIAVRYAARYLQIMDYLVFVRFADGQTFIYYLSNDIPSLGYKYESKYDYHKDPFRGTPL